MFLIIFLHQAKLNDNCETQMTPNAQQSLGNILTKIASGEVTELKGEMRKRVQL